MGMKYAAPHTDSEIACGVISASVQRTPLDEAPTGRQAAATTKSREARTQAAPRNAGTRAIGKCVINSDVGALSNTCVGPGLVMIPNPTATIRSAIPRTDYDVTGGMLGLATYDHALSIRP
jgi:hypothetical protein